VIADMARSGPPMVSSFVAELARRLQGQGPALALPLTWIEQRLSESGLTIDQLVQSENQQQAADQVSSATASGASAFWGDGLARVRRDDERRRADPAGGSRRRLRQDGFYHPRSYRHVVEKIAKHSRLSEHEVARSAIELAHVGATRNGGDDRAAHVGST